MNTVFQAVPEPESRPAERTPDQVVDICLLRTAEALRMAGAAADEELLEAFAKVRNSMAKGIPMDLLDALARVIGYEEERIGQAILRLSDAVASTIKPAPAWIPFAGKLIAPSAFYDSFDVMHKLGKQLLTPVIFAEDTDAIGTASVNPIAAQLLAEEIQYAVAKRFGIRPFMTVARMGYESWTFLCRKHFEL